MDTSARIGGDEVPFYGYFDTECNVTWFRARARLPSWPSLPGNIKARGAVVADTWQEITASFDIHGVIYNRRRGRE